MIYLDTSVALAELLAEDRHPPEEFWQQEIISSRLLEYELWSSIHRRKLRTSHGDAARQLIESIAITELSREILRRVIEPFPVPVRTLDAMHLATVVFLQSQGIEIHLAAYDTRMVAAAKKLRIPLVRI